MEMCDVFDQSGARTGKIVARGTELQPDEYYLVVQVWIRDENGVYLVQQRGLHLLSSPGIWATTAGYILSGEESIAGAVREVSEELGIQLSSAQLKRFNRLAMNGLMQDIWLAEVSRDAMDRPVSGPEVANWKWASKSELTQMIGRGEFFAYSYFDQLPE
ncbi:MAG TPA: NUDIX domain-containing protein [Phototrophicaceae bacterium]|nr:NUDIX domain-containing protein [Phototrophicaceae bacterium]